MAISINKLKKKKIETRHFKKTDAIKAGMIGVGYWVLKPARNFHELPGAVLKIVADLKPDRLQEINHLFPDAVTTSTASCINK